MNYIIILSLILIYTASVCTIFGSINLWNEKQGAGKLKQAVLDWGYQYSVFWTNFAGLWLSGTLQVSPLCVVSWYYLLLGIMMPVCYWFSYKYFNNGWSKFTVYNIWDYGVYKDKPVTMTSQKIIIDNLAEWLWGGFWGLGLALAW